MQEHSRKYGHNNKVDNNQASLPDDSLAVPCIGNKVSNLRPNTHGAGKLTAKM